MNNKVHRIKNKSENLSSKRSGKGRQEAEYNDYSQIQNLNALSICSILVNFSFTYNTWILVCNLFLRNKETLNRHEIFSFPNKQGIMETIYMCGFT